MDIGLLPGRCSPHIRSAVSLCPAGVAKQRWRSGWVVGWYIKIRRSVSGPKWGQQVDRSMDYRCIDHDDQEEDHITPRPRPRALARSREVLVFTACAAGEGKRGGCRLPPETCVYYITTCPRDHVACGHARGAHGGRPRHPRSTAGRPADGITRTYVRRTRARGAAGRVRQMGSRARPGGPGWWRASLRRPRRARGTGAGLPLVNVRGGTSPGRQRARRMRARWPSLRCAPRLRFGQQGCARRSMCTTRPVHGTSLPGEI